MTDSDKLIKEINYEIYLSSEIIKQEKKKIKMLTQKKQTLEGYNHLEKSKNKHKAKKLNRKEY